MGKPKLTSVFVYFISPLPFILLQCGFSPHHNTETTPIKFTSKVHLARSIGHLTVLKLKVLSAALNTVDHSLLEIIFFRGFSDVTLPLAGSPFANGVLNFYKPQGPLPCITWMGSWNPIALNTTGILILPNCVFS